MDLKIMGLLNYIYCKIHIFMFSQDNSFVAYVNNRETVNNYNGVTGNEQFVKQFLTCCEHLSILICVCVCVCVCVCLVH